MIDRTEILELAAEQALSPQVVEKDYVLGWLLRGYGYDSIRRGESSLRRSRLRRTCTAH